MFPPRLSFKVKPFSLGSSGWRTSYEHTELSLDCDRSPGWRAVMGAEPRTSIASTAGGRHAVAGGSRRDRTVAGTEEAAHSGQHVTDRRPPRRRGRRAA